MNKKLRFLHRSTGVRNILLEPAILECVLGPQEGSKRIIDVFVDEFRGKPVAHDAQRKVFVVTETSNGWHRLTPGTDVTYDTFGGTISYTCGDTKYIIRAVQDGDVL
jgi:hypothetical protein